MSEWPDRIGAYPIEREIGRGGMGIVYLARDEELDRAVAIKVLPDSVSDDPVRLARFDREARMLGALNHPNIAAIYGIEQDGDRRFLVLEYVAGPTLAEVLGNGPLPLDDALQIGQRIAAALEAAHESGIIHRDLKPANVKITPSGDAKVLDFGLARQSPDSGAGFTPPPAEARTFSGAMTLDGLVLGTPGYMSPEQARGRPVDRRTDIWSFGCVLFECVSGCTAFGGDTASDRIARILQSPPDWSALPPGVPDNIRHLLERCLEKEPKKRLRDIGDARLEIEAALTGGGSTTRAQAPVTRAAPRRNVRVLAAVAGGAVLGALAMFAGTRVLAPDGPAAGDMVGALRLSVPIPRELRVQVIVEETQAIPADISPDGQTVVFAGSAGAGQPRMLYTRRLDSPDCTLVEGTERVEGPPSISPDGQYIHFRARLADTATARHFYRVRLDGSEPPTRIGEAPVHDSWLALPDGRILVTVDNGRAFKVLSPTGDPAGPPTRIDTEDATGRFDLGYLCHRSVVDDQTVLAVVHYVSGGAMKTGVAALRLDTGKATRLIDEGRYAIVVAPGWLLFSRGETLLVAPFDAAGYRLTGAPQAIFRGIRTLNSSTSGHFRLSASGTLLYAPGGLVGEKRTLAFIGQDGSLTPFVTDNRSYSTAFFPGVSMDGRRVAVVLTNEQNVDEIWITSVTEPILSRVAARPGFDIGAPVLSRDGSLLAYRATGLDGRSSLHLKSLDGGGPDRLLVDASRLKTYLYPTSFAPDGRALLFDIASGDGAVGLARWDDDPARPPEVSVAIDEAGWEIEAVFSPDGRHVAFASKRDGTPRVYVAAYSAAGRIGHAVAVARGQRPEWSADGRQLRYVDAGTLFTVPLSTHPVVRAGAPVRLFDTRGTGIGAYRHLPDGRIVAVVKSPEQGDLTRFDLALNWGQGLLRRVSKQ